MQKILTLGKVKTPSPTRIDEDLDEIKAAVGNNQKKLMAAVAEIENGREETLPMTQELNR